MKRSTGNKTLWAELLPYEFKRRLDECPIVYLPLGLCEPHGQVSAFGLDTIKAEWLCRRTAETVGGIVAPSMGYHIHETGYHARWLEDEVGEENPHMTGIPPAVFIHLFLYQLRAFANAGFRKIVVVSGHSGGNQIDLRMAADSFVRRFSDVEVWVRSDPELAEGLFEGDHAGKYEISQLMYVRPDLIEMNKIGLGELPGSGGRLALGGDAAEASAERGRLIMEACLESLVKEASRMKEEARARPPKDGVSRIAYADIEEIWSDVSRRADKWVTSNPWPSQEAVTPRSQWKPFERYAIRPSTE